MVGAVTLAGARSFEAFQRRASDLIRQFAPAHALYAPKGEDSTAAQQHRNAEHRLRHPVKPRLAPEGQDLSVADASLVARLSMAGHFGRFLACSVPHHP